MLLDRTLVILWVKIMLHQHKKQCVVLVHAYCRHISTYSTNNLSAIKLLMTVKLRLIKLRFIINYMKNYFRKWKMAQIQLGPHSNNTRTLEDQHVFIKSESVHETCRIYFVHVNLYYFTTHKEINILYYNFYHT